MSNVYAGLRRNLKSEPGAAERLLALRSRLAPVRAHESDSSLLLATWNIHRVATWAVLSALLLSLGLNLRRLPDVGSDHFPMIAASSPTPTCAGPPN